MCFFSFLFALFTRDVAKNRIRYTFFSTKRPPRRQEAKSKIVLLPNLRALSANANPYISAVIFEEIKVLFGCDRVISPELPRRASRLLYSQHSRSALAKNSNLRTVYGNPCRRAAPAMTVAEYLFACFYRMSYSTLRNKSAGREILRFLRLSYI